MTQQTEPTNIRVFVPADKQQVIDLWLQVFPADPPWNKPEDLIERKMLVQPELFFVATQGQTVVGTILAGFDGVRGWVHKVAVTPGLRRGNIARSLMHHAELALADLGCPKLNLQVRSDNSGAMAFYTAAGYTEEDRVSFGKQLSRPEKTLPD